MSSLAGLAHWPAAARLGGPHWAPVLGYGSLALITATLALAAVLGSPQAIVTATLGLLLGLAILWLCVRGGDRQFLMTLFLVAFAVRIAAALVSHHALLYFGREGFLLLDDRAYSKLGWTLARVWMGIFPGIRDTDQYLMVNYTYLVAGVYYLLGQSLLAAKMMNVAFGAFTAVVVYGIGKELFGSGTGRIAALLAAFFPSLIAWSALNLKDMLTILATSLTVFGLLRYSKHHHWSALALSMLALLALENLRPHAFLILVWLLPLGFILIDRSAPLRKLALLTPLVLCLALISLSTNNEELGIKWFTPKALTEAEWMRYVGAKEAETGIPGNDVKPPKDTSDIVGRSLQYLPTGVFYAIFGPLPWDARSGSARAVIPEMLLWYGVLAATLVGFRVSFRESWRVMVLPAAFAAAWLVALAWIGGNTGNFFRQRGMMMPFIFPIAAVGLQWLWGSLQARRTGLARRPVGLPSPTSLHEREVAR